MPIYDFKKAPPLALPVAYALALRRIGPATNRFHCVTATCLERSNNWSTGWTFEFSSTNAQHATVKVFFNTRVWLDPQTAALLK